MALVRFGGGVAELRGSVGGVTYSRNTFGAYARNRIVPTNPASVRQVEIRSNLSALVAAWSLTCTQTNRDEWDAFAAGTPMTNKLGETIYLSGFGQFVRCNMARLEAGATPILGGPEISILPPGDVGFAVTPSEGSQNLSVVFTTGQAWLSEVGAHMLVYQGKPYPAGRAYVNGPFKYAGKISGAATPPTSPQTLTSQYPITEGQKCMFYCRITRLDGTLSTKYFYSTSVAV